MIRQLSAQPPPPPQSPAQGWRWTKELLASHSSSSSPKKGAVNKPRHTGGIRSSKYLAPTRPYGSVRGRERSSACSHHINMHAWAEDTTSDLPISLSLILRMTISPFFPLSPSYEWFDFLLSPLPPLSPCGLPSPILMAAAV